MPKHSDTLLAAATTIIVVAVLALGFHELEPREKNRAIRADEQRVLDLRSIAQLIHSQRDPPASLAALPNALPYLNDPVTHMPYEYHPQSSTHYQLCATFAAKTPESQIHQPYFSFWNHQAGRQCFELNTLGPAY